MIRLWRRNQKFVDRTPRNYITENDLSHLIRTTLGGYRLDKVEQTDKISLDELLRLERFVSLWDILQYYAHDFIWILKSLEEHSKGKNAIELLINSRSHRLATLKEDKEHFECLHKLSSRLGMRSTQSFCEEILRISDNLLFNDSVYPQILKEKLMEYFKFSSMLPDAIIADLKGVSFYHVGFDLVKYCEDGGFSSQVKDAFPDAIYDMKETGKCFALGRHTACVFHLMRVVEVGLKSLKDYCGIGDFSPNWGATLSKVSEHIKSLNRKTQHTEVNKLQQVAARIGAIKDAWRNPTMHVEQRYNSDQAKEVFDAVRAFMDVLCTELA